MTNKTHSVLYIGITNDLERRIAQHQAHLIPGFTSKYKVHKLIFFEEYEDVQEAINRETCLKRWKRTWKEALINTVNPMWRDLGEELFKT